MNRPLVILLSLSLLLPAFFTSCAVSPAASETAVAFAKQRVANEVGGEPRKGTLVIVDYTKPSSEKRMTVVNLKNGKSKMNFRVAHGVNSGLLYATDFSNRPGSNKSSLGLYEISEEFNGKHGTSFRLDGLDPYLNDNARDRGIIVHSADYATRDAMKENRHQYFRLGRSAGCLALSDRDLAKLDRKLVRPAYVFAYAPVLAQMQPERPLAPAPAATFASLNLSPQPAREKPAAVRPLIPEKRAIARPTVIDTGPVTADRDLMPVSLFTVSGALSRP